MSRTIIAHANFTFDRRYRSPICSHAGIRAPLPVTFLPILSLYNNVAVLDPSLSLPRSLFPSFFIQTLFEHTLAQGARDRNERQTESREREREREKGGVLRAYYSRTLCDWALGRVRAHLTPTQSSRTHEWTSLCGTVYAFPSCLSSFVAHTCTRAACACEHCASHSLSLLFRACKRVHVLSWGVKRLPNVVNSFPIPPFPSPYPPTSAHPPHPDSFPFSRRLPLAPRRFLSATLYHTEERREREREGWEGEGQGRYAEEHVHDPTLSFFSLLLFFLLFFFLFLFLVSSFGHRLVPPLLLPLDLIRRLISGGAQQPRATCFLRRSRGSRCDFFFLGGGGGEERVGGQGWIGPTWQWIPTFFSLLFRMFYLDLRDCLDRNGSRENGNGIFLGNGSFAHRCALLSGPCWRIGWRWFDWSRGRLWM